jgi:hypothetical protein
VRARKVCALEFRLYLDGFDNADLNSESTFDWTGEEWTVPVNLPVSHIYNFGKQPVSLALDGRVYAVTPDEGPEWGLRRVARRQRDQEARIANGFSQMTSQTAQAGLKRKGDKMSESKWLGDKDSNLDWRSQSPLSYR